MTMKMVRWIIAEEIKIIDSVACSIDSSLWQDDVWVAMKDGSSGYIEKKEIVRYLFP